MQKLIMPFCSQMMLCGYKNTRYTAAHGYLHYGIDVSTIQGAAGSDHTVYASGEGKIIACGFDNSGGNVVVMVYPEAYNHKTAKYCDLVARYMHLASIAVKAGQTVRQGDVLGVEGNTQTGDYHLHLEFDTDTKWELYSPQVSSADDKKTAAQGNILKKGTDSVVNPSYVLHLGKGQQIVKPTYNPAWLNPEDYTIPTLHSADSASIVALKARIAELETEVSRANSRSQSVAVEIRKILEKYKL